MKLSRTTTYAVQASLQLARAMPGQSVPCRQMAHDGRLPERFLLQILRSLVNQGIMHSTRGVEGGYHLARSPDRITLLDIVETFDNPLDPAMPYLEGMSPNVRSRILRTLNKASHATRHSLQELTIADLIAIDLKPNIAS